LQGEPFDARVIEALARYGSLVLDAKHCLNVTGARSPEAIAIHIRDSLTVLPYLAEPYADVGSGAGFPAIPVAISTGMAITLIEATAKKARLLETLLKTLRLDGRVLAERAEIAGHRPELREAFSSGTCRAVASAPAVAELLLPLIAPGGTAILQRGRFDEPERRALEGAAFMLGGIVESEHPLDGERRIVVLRKQAPSPIRVPRRAGAAQKRPLCQ
jgi:16S rRNA (guanine527-N7)-methyltransferase